MAFNFIRAAAAGAAMALCGVGSVHAAVNLPALKIDKTQTTVSGLSSGGFMAVQLHVAYSATFAKGAGVVAGGDMTLEAVVTKLMLLMGRYPDNERVARGLVTNMRGELSPPEHVQRKFYSKEMLLSKL